MLQRIADEERRHVPQFQPARSAPSGEPIGGAFVRLPGVRVSGLRLEEVGIGVLGVRTCIPDDFWGGDLATEPHQVVVDDPLVPFAARAGAGRPGLDLAPRLAHASTPCPDCFNAG
jgi:hypothetical protein